MNKVLIQLHGNLFKNVKQQYNLAVKSVAEAVHSINILTDNKFYQELLENDKKGIQYRVLINGRDFEYEKKPTTEEPESIAKTELAMNVKDLKTIDIVPVIEGGTSDIGAIIAGVLLIILGVLVSIWVPVVGTYLGAALIMGGIGLIAAGVINLLSSPPKFEEFREISGGGRASYLFNGPQNTVREGGPVSVGYGRLIVGSHVISASYDVTDVSAKTNPLTV